MQWGEVVGAGALWLAIPIALLAGLVSFASPCVLPLIPGYLGFIGGAVAPQESGRAGRARLIGGVLLFIAGFTVVFVAVIVLGGLAGGATQIFAIQYGELITRILGIVVIALGLVFLGVFGIAQRTLRPRLRGNLGLVGAPLLGMTLGFGWAPCMGPTLAAIIAISYQQADAGRAILLGLAYSAGLGVPFLLVAFGFGWATRSLAFLRRHIRLVNLVGAGMLILLGVLMVTGVWTQIMSRLGAALGSITTVL